MRIESADSAVNPGHYSAWWTPLLAWPLLAAAVVRFTLLAVSLARTGTSGLALADTSSYLMPGRNLLLHGSFMVDGVPDLLRTPGYPLFLALTSVAGLPLAAVANVFLSVFSVFLVWKLGRTVFGDDRIALVAAWIFAFEPMSVIFSVALMSDTLFLVPFLFGMERLAEFLRRRRLPVLAVAGLWLAAATFVRPTTYYLAAALALGLFVVLARVPGMRWKAPAVLLISVLPWLAAWQLRNKVETGYGGFSSIADMNLYFYDASSVTARVEHRSWYDVRKEYGFSQFVNSSGQMYLDQPYLTLHPEQAGWSQAQRLAFTHSEGVRVIRAHPGVYLHAYLSRLLMIVFNPGAGFFDRVLISGGPRHNNDIIDEGPVRWGVKLMQTYPGEAAEKAAFAVILLGLYLFAARGVFRCGVDKAYLWLLLGTALYIFAASAAGGGSAAEARYRLPIMPIVCILAAAGVLRTKATAI